MFSSAFIMFAFAVLGGMTIPANTSMKAEHLVIYALFEFRYASAGFMIVYVEIWSLWNTLRE